MSQLSRQRRCTITDFADVVFVDFITYLNREGLPTLKREEMFGRGSRYDRPNPHLERFFTFALECIVGSIGAIVIDQNVSHPDQPKPAAWLIQPSANDPNACIILDPDRCHNTVTQNTSRLINYLCLHEIGHVFLHWDALFDGNLGPRARYAQPQQEAEAWCFCFALAMICAEEVAWSFRENPQSDSLHVWEMIAGLRL